jgi:3-deoxy-manno-octulosonate cytidylyltransferase (CMP-KDO synthetase)
MGPGYAAVRKILGIIGYRRAFLLRYGALSRTPCEEASGIDQLRVIEHDLPLRTVEFANGYPGINEPREVPVVEAYLTQDPAQQAVLGQVLAAA